MKLILPRRFGFDVDWLKTGCRRFPYFDESSAVLLPSRQIKTLHLLGDAFRFTICKFKAHGFVFSQRIASSKEGTSCVHHDWQVKRNERIDATEGTVRQTAVDPPADTKTAVGKSSCPFGT